MRRVTQAKAIREWLRVERRNPDAEGPAVETLSERAALDELLERNPGAAAFVWRDAPVEWYALTVDRSALERLRVVEGPEDLGWNALSPDGTVVGAARRIAAVDPDELAAETGVDLATVRRYREDPPGGPFVLSTRRGCVPRFVADGNHRAVALVLRVLAGEPFRPPRAYLGVGANPVRRPLVERVCGLGRRLVSECIPNRDK